MSPSPNPGSSQDEGPVATSPPRAVVGSAANVDAAHLRRKRAAKFRCEQCGRTFTARHNLNNHENAHKGIRPFPCKNGCGQRFTTAGTATRHAKTFPAATLPSALIPGLDVLTTLAPRIHGPGLKLLLLSPVILLVYCIVVTGSLWSRLRGSI
ncbi:hypothetical protein FB45DRAFT_260173 [Roridomyces roridus]|uniref:C2H2-type domain-containing protein n=1 Tax=Roridomyces roridus TaxID=1738132 RepID=A0AAD7B940_9AGAR|nr:hypothetical protein FB45DRAFT_260173 [Roridomyces roridus]